MSTIRGKRLLLFIIIVCAMGLLVGCAGMERAPRDRPGYMYYPKALPEASRTLDEARMAGKDKECPAEFNAAKDMVDEAYAVYMACRDKDAIAKAQEASGKIRTLCPSRPVAEVKPEPKPALPLPAKEPVKIGLEDIYFDYDKAKLTQAAKEVLARDIKILKENPGVSVQLEGHSCAHGADAYNMALSERRTNAVREYLVKAGISKHRMTTISYGETRLSMPETPTPKNKDSEEARANRRVHFEVIVK